MKKVEDYVRTIPDFPEPGIMFRDVTSVLQDADGLHLAIDAVQGLLEGREAIICRRAVLSRYTCRFCDCGFGIKSFKDEQLFPCIGNYGRFRHSDEQEFGSKLRQI